MNDFSNGLINCRNHYPFESWYKIYLLGTGGLYNRKNCEMMQSIFDSLIDELIKLGENASQEKKLLLFKFAVERLNTIVRNNSVLIETEERSEFISLFDEIAVASGMNVEDFEYGITSEWREW